MSMEQALYCFACGSQRITSQGCNCQTFKLSREQLIRMRDAWVLEASDQALTSSGDDVEKAAWAMATVIANRHHPRNAATIGDIEHWMTDARREEARAALTARNNG